MNSDPRPAAASPDDPLAERRIGGERVYDGTLLDVRRDRARMPDGSEAVREYIVHPGAVLVVPVHDDGRMIVERQFRYPHNRSFLEFPAGKLDPGESALESGVRELIGALSRHCLGFDHAKVIEAMGSTEDANFIVWMSEDWKRRRDEHAGRP